MAWLRLGFGLAAAWLFPEFPALSAVASVASFCVRAQPARDRSPPPVQPTACAAHTRKSTAGTARGGRHGWSRLDATRRQHPRAPARGATQRLPVQLTVSNTPGRVPELSHVAPTSTCGGLSHTGTRTRARIPCTPLSLRSVHTLVRAAGYFPERTSRHRTGDYEHVSGVGTRRTLTQPWAFAFHHPRRAKHTTARGTLRPHCARTRCHGGEPHHRNEKQPQGVSANLRVTAHKKPR